MVEKSRLSSIHTRFRSGPIAQIYTAAGAAQLRRDPRMSLLEISLFRASSGSGVVLSSGPTIIYNLQPHYGTPFVSPECDQLKYGLSARSFEGSHRVKDRASVSTLEPSACPETSSMRRRQGINTRHSFDLVVYIVIDELNIPSTRPFRCTGTQRL